MAGNDNSDGNVFDKFAELVKRAKAGDESAFEEIYESTKRFVFVTSLEIVKNEQDAEDVMQDVYLALFKKLDTIKNEKALMRWLAVATGNRSRDRVKYSKDEPSYEEFACKEADIAGDDDLEHLPDALILEKEKRETFYKIMRNELSDVQFQTVLLHYYDQLDVPEIAQIMDCSKDTVKTRLKLARVKIKKGIREFEKTSNIKLLGGIAGVGNLGSFFSEFYRNTKIPAIKQFPVKTGTGTKIAAKTASKAAVKSAAGTSAKAAAGSSSAKVLGIIGASVLGIGVIGGIVLVIKNMAGDQNKESLTYEAEYDDRDLDFDKEAMQTETSVTNKTEPVEKTGRVITVTDAVNENYDAFNQLDGFSYTYSFVVPKVNISDMNTDAANDRILEELSSYHNETMTELPAETEYVYYVDDSIVSIFVRIRTHDYDESPTSIYYRAFNISAETGELLAPSEMLGLQSLTDEEFFGMVDVLYRDAAEQHAKNCRPLGGDDIDSIYEEAYKQNLDLMTFKYIEPFISKDGHLCFKGQITSTDQGYEETVFDTSTQSRISWKSLTE